MICRLRIYALLLILCTLSAQVEKQSGFTPHNTVFFFDLHDVILKPDTGKRVKLFLKHPIRSVRFATHVATQRDWANGEKLALELKKKGHNKQAEIVRTFSAAYKVDTEVFKILQDLKSEGYTLCMASNIGVNNLNDLRDPAHRRNKIKSPSTITLQDVFALFDDMICVDYESPEVITKPNHRYFTMLKERCGHDNVIFIDDNKKNIAAAHTCGLHAMHFTSAKKLTKDLKTIGVF